MKPFYKLWYNLMFWRKRVEDKAKEVLEIKIDYFDPDLNPSQDNKPSPHSSLLLSQGIKLLKKIFPSTTTHWVTTVANTNSMEPFIDDNSVVALEKLTDKILNLQPIAAGDIVIWYREKDKTYIIHKVQQISESGKSFYIKGDNNYFADGWVPIHLIKYRLCALIYTKQRRKND